MVRRTWHEARAVVTGASSGIGEAIAEELSVAGSRLVLSGRRADALQSLASRCRAAGSGAETVAGDLTRPEVRTAIAESAQGLGGLDLLVHCAGVSTSALFAEIEPPVIRRVLEVNFFAAAELTRLMLPALVASRGHIVVLSSLTGLVGTPRRSAYAASKHALHGLFSALRVELRQHRVGVTLVCPGYVDTPIRRRAFLADGSAQGDDPVEGRTMLSPRQVARRTLRAALRRDRLVLMGRETWLARALSLVAPALFDRILERHPG